MSAVHRRLTVWFVVSLFVTHEPCQLFAQTGTQSTDGVVSLFSGDSLDGWVVQRAGGASTEQGTLVVTDRAGWVRTARNSFGTFALTFDARARMPGVRAFVAILGRLASGFDAGDAYALPLFDGGIPDVTFGSVRLHVLPVNPAGIGRALREPIEWQSFRLERRSDGIVASINGAHVVSVDGPRTLDGWIGFLVQGGGIEVRNIQLGPGQTPRTSTVLRPGGDVKLPRVLHEERPRYTSAAMSKRIQGTVLLECVVEANGSVSQAVVVRSLDPYDGLDQEAVRAARLWRFSPGTKDGKPVPVLVTIELTFTLGNK